MDSQETAAVSVSSSLSFVQRQIIAGAVGSITTTLVLNPVGVIKVRTQAGHGGIFEVAKQVIRNEGFRGFWMGSGLGMVQSIPSTVIYMTSYENIKLKLTNLVEEGGHDGGVLTGIIPGLSGAIARSLVVTVLAPLELVRTRTLAGMGSATTLTRTSSPSSQAAQSQSVWNLIKTIHRTEGGVSAFYRGLSSTIMRDTPFSAIYWMSFEAVKNNVYSHLLLHEDNRESTRTENATVNFLSGSTSGALAAIITHPFDVLKTQSQLAAAVSDPHPAGSAAASSASSAMSSQTACARQVCRIMAECCCPCTSSVAATGAGVAAETVTASSVTAVPVSPLPTSRAAPLSMRQGLAQIIRSRGLTGLFSGLSMRLATIIPGSGIMITVYEFAKTFDLKP